MATTLIGKVREIFNLAHNGSVVTSKLCERLTTIQNDNGEGEAFWDSFIHHVQKSIIYFKNEPSVERVMDFIANYAIYLTHLKNKEKLKEKKGDSTKIFSSSEGSDDDDEEELMEPFLLKCFGFFIDHHNARDKAVRLRCCQMVNKLLNLLGDQAAIDEELCDSIYNCMMIRIKDTVPPIRVQAVLALARLQDPSDPECPVIDAYLSTLSKDVHFLVRKMILKSLAISRKTLPYIIERVRDVKDVNRKAAFMILCEKVSLRALSIAQRNKLVIDGLKNERSDDVKKACSEMLKAWFRSCNYNFVKLLEALDTESGPECSAVAMENLLQGESIEKLQEYSKQIDGFQGNVEKFIQPEEVFFWYSFCKHLKSCPDGDVILQEILPELTGFVEFVRRYSEKNFMDSISEAVGPSEFILENLLHIIGFLDMTDELGRKKYYTLVHDLLSLQNTPITLVKVLVKCYKDLEKNEDAFIQAVVETISDVKQPLVKVVSEATKEKTRMLQLQLSRISVSIEDCKEDLECAVKQEDFLQASLLKDNIAELEKQKNEISGQLEECQEEITERFETDNDPTILLKCLTIGTEMLSNIVKRGVNPTLMTLKDELYIEGVKNEDPYIRNEAIRGLGLLSLLKKEFAAQHLVFFLQVVQVDQEFVKMTAIKIIFDCFLMYGVSTFDTDSKTDENGTSNLDKSLNATDATYDDTVIAETPPENQGEDDVDNEDVESTNAAERVVGVLLMFLQNESSDLRTLVAEGLAKVMITGRVVSANILTRLIILWYNPITEDDVHLRHCLGVFLPAFAFQSRKNQELVEESFLPSLRIITNAPPTSPLTHINISNVIDLFVQLTDVRNLSKVRNNNKKVLDSYDNHIHDSIALKLSNEILTDPEDPDVKIFCKALNLLSICPENIPVIQDLQELSCQMMKALSKNRMALNMIEKFVQNLNDILVLEDKIVELSETVTDGEGKNKTALSETLKNNENISKIEKTMEVDKTLVNVENPEATITKDKENIDIVSELDNTVVNKTVNKQSQPTQTTRKARTTRSSKTSSSQSPKSKKKR